MDTLSLIGIILAVGFYMGAAFFGFNLVAMSAIATSVAFLLSGINPMTGMTTSFLPAVGGFVKSYFLIFGLSALLGRIMSDSGTGRSIALTLLKVIEKSKNAKTRKILSVIFVCVIYFVLCYSGINAMVMMFVVMPIAKDLFERTDTPWRFYCCGGTLAPCSLMFPGSLSATNIDITRACGDTITNGALAGVLMCITFWIAFIILLVFVINGTEKKGEGFMKTGAAIKASNVASAEMELPNFVLSLLPIAILIVMCVGFSWNIVPVLCIACVVNALVGYKNLKGKFKSTIANGVTSCYGALLGVAATYAIGYSLKSLAGFSVIEAALGTFSPAVHGASLSFLANLIMANATAASAAFDEQACQLMVSGGLSVGLSHRILCWASTASMAPHNPAYSNVEAVLKIPYKESVKVYALFTFIPGFITLGVTILLISLGVIG